MEVLRRLPGVIATSLLLAIAALFGFIGSPNRGERFDAKTIILEPGATGGLRVTEFVDIDFGHVQRHGYERVLRTDFGEPTDIEAYSATVSDQIFTDPGFSEFGIRIGDPNVTVSGRHRFVLAYTLPAAPMDQNFNLSVIDPGEEFETGRFTVVLDGFRLDDPLCSVGDLGEIGGCDLTEGDVGQQVVFEPLAAGAGVNLSGSAVIAGEPVGIDPGPTFPPVEDPSTLWRAVLVALAAFVAGGWIVMRAIQRGSNEVAAVDAGGAAFPVAGSPTRRVTDGELAAMATVEFAPPDGIAPWEGRVLLDENVSSQTVSAWLSSQLGTGTLTADESDDGVVLTRTDVVSSADEEVLLRTLVPGGSRTVPPGYSAGFASAWSTLQSKLAERIAARNWWTRMASQVGLGPRIASIFLGIVLVGMLAGAGLAFRFSGASAGALSGNVIIVVVAAALIGLVVGLMASAGAWASRTATGSAAFLRTESFRRFLAASEATHVEQALERGVLREYTAWAVALGEAEAWERAAKALGNAAVVSTVATTAFMHHHHSTFSSATTAPSSSGGGGGGGGAGGGGGGGSSGSW
ncbi:MAG: DUF2207 family protein [Ilumatobacteraceae bacterium]